MLLAKNKKAYHDVEVLTKYVAGIALLGREVKAAREGNVNFEGSYVRIVGEELFVINLHIGRYEKQSQEYDEKESRRSRKLLVTKKEVVEITRETSEKGKSAVPLALILEHNLLKLEFAVVKGRKEYEKKTVAIAKQVDRDLERARKIIAV